uniref:Uncharacterized protein n=1 Tax=Arcella intermedia TaxID=1963864 RepID=A0A6B2L1W7_9EUKA
MLIQEFQIDNQLPSAPYPVLLHTRIRDHPQFFKGSLLFSEEQRNLYHLHYLSFLMNQLEISIDEHLAIQLMRFIDLTMESLEKEEESKKIKEPSKEATDLPDQQMLYATLVHFNPIRIRLSFRGNRKGEQNEENSKKFDTASKLLSLPKTLIPNVDRAPIIFKALLVQGALTSTSDIAERLSRHYLNQLNSQIYSLLGSAQVLGSPISFVADLSDGVADFFYEPAKGMTLSPEEFLKGIGKGSFSLVRNSIFSLFGSASKITGSLGTGVALLSFDDKYQERRLQQKHTQASNVVDGFATGVEELGKGIFGGLFGIVADPVKGAIKSGPVGLVTGLAKGVVNVVVKPTVGVMDFASRVTEGIQNTPDEFLEKAKPKRKPRYFPTDNRLECFDHEKAYGKYIVSLHSETDIYIDHIHIHQPIVGYCFVLDSSILITYPDYSAKTILTFPGLESVTLKKVNDKHFAIYFIKKETFMITANKLEAEKIYPIIKNAWNQWKERPDLE